MKKLIIGCFVTLFAMSTLALDSNEQSVQDQFCANAGTYISENLVPEMDETVCQLYRRGRCVSFGVAQGALTGKTCLLIPESDARILIDYQFDYSNSHSNQAQVKGKVKCVFAADNLQEWECGYKESKAVLNGMDKSELNSAMLSTATDAVNANL